MSVQGPGSGAHKHFTATYGTAYDSKSSEVEDNFQMKASVIYLTLLSGESAGGPAGVHLLLPPGDHLPLLHLVLLHGQYQYSTTSYRPAHTVPRQIVKEYERAVVFRLGRLRSGGAKGPGLMLVMPCIDSYRCIDLRCCVLLLTALVTGILSNLRTGAFDVPPQEILTRDSVTISVDAVVYYQVHRGET